MNLASVWNLPAVFVAENNGYAETTSSTWSVASDNIADRAAGFGMPGIDRGWLRFLRGSRGGR